MNFDFSPLENIDFKNTDNLLFLSLLLVSSIIIFLISVLIAIKIIKAIEKLITKIFNKSTEKPEFVPRAMHQIQKNGLADIMARPKVLGGDFFRKPSNKEENKNETRPQARSAKRDVAKELAMLKSSKKSGEAIASTSIHGQKLTYGQEKREAARRTLRSLGKR